MLSLHFPYGEMFFLFLWTVACLLLDFSFLFSGVLCRRTMCVLDNGHSVWVSVIVTFVYDFILFIYQFKSYEITIINT